MKFGKINSLGKVSKTDFLLKMWPAGLVRLIPSAGFIFLTSFMNYNYSAEESSTFISAVSTTLFCVIIMQFGIENYIIRKIASQSENYRWQTAYLLSLLVCFTLMFPFAMAGIIKMESLYLTIGLFLISTFSAEAKGSSRPALGSFLELGSLFFYFALFLCANVYLEISRRPVLELFLFFTVASAVLLTPIRFITTLGNSGTWVIEKPIHSSFDIEERFTLFVFSLQIYLVQWGVISAWGAYFSHEDFVIISILYKCSFVMLFFSTLINTVYSPAFARLWSNGEIQSFSNLYRTTKKAGIVLVAISAPAYLVYFLTHDYWFPYNNDLNILFLSFIVVSSISLVYGSTNYCMMMSGHSKALNLISLLATSVGMFLMAVAMQSGRLYEGVYVFSASLVIKFLLLDHYLRSKVGKSIGG